jgi:hypothetical protein
MAFLSLLDDLAKLYVVKTFWTDGSLINQSA